MVEDEARNEQRRIDRGRLGTYLNDHLAGATLGTRAAQRAAKSNKDSEHGQALRQLAHEVEEDRKALRNVMAALDLPENPIKKFSAFLMERAGTLKLNGRLLSYSPLSRLLELEGLLLGAMGKRCMWQTLDVVALHEPGLRQFDFAALQARAERHVSTLGQLRLDARLPAFSEPLSGKLHDEKAAPPAQPRYTGPERRSGAERRMKHVFMGPTDRRTDRAALR